MGEGGKRLTARQIERNELSTSQLHRMLDEALEGEQNLTEIQEKCRKLSARLSAQVETEESEGEVVSLEQKIHRESTLKVKASRRKACGGTHAG